MSRDLLLAAAVCLAVGAGCAGSRRPAAAPPPGLGTAGAARDLLVRLLEGRVALQPLEPYLAPGVTLAVPAAGARLRQYRVEADVMAPPAYGWRVQGFWDQGSQGVSSSWEGFTVTYEAGAYRVTRAEALPGAVRVTSRDGFSLTYQDGSEAIPLMDTRQDLPMTVRPYGAQAGVEFGPGRDLRALALAPDGQRIAFLTTGVHGFLGVVEVEDGRRRPGIRSLDLYYGGGGREVAWSLDGRQLAVTVAMPRGHVALFVGYLDGQRREVPLPGDPADLRWLEGQGLRFHVGEQLWQYDPVSGRAGAVGPGRP